MGFAARARVACSCSMLEYTLVVETVTLPALVIHGGAGNYLATTSAEQRRERGRRLADIARRAQACMTERARDGVMAAIGDLERDPLFNAGRGSRLQRDGVARMSVALADGAQQRTSAIYNVQDCLNPSELALALQDAGDRNLDATVNVDDLNIVLSQWGMAVPPFTGGDDNGDGQVTVNDLNIILSHWANTCP